MTHLNLSSVLDIPIYGLHAPEWVEDLGYEGQDATEIQSALREHYDDPVLPTGTYSADLVGVSEEAVAPLFRSAKWVFSVTQRINPEPARLPWKVIAFGHTGQVYGHPEHELTLWITTMLGRPLLPAELEAVGLVAFVGEKFEIEINNRGRVESCRMLPPCERVRPARNTNESPMVELRAWCKARDRQGSALIPQPTIDDWWHAATARFRSGEYCRAWHHQQYDRRPRVVMSSRSGFEAIATADRNTAGGTAAR